jgi:hypothetical protein
MARRRLEPLDELQRLEKEAELRLVLLDLAESLGLLERKDRRQYLCEVDPETALYESLFLDESIWH